MQGKRRVGKAQHRKEHREKNVNFSSLKEHGKRTTKGRGGPKLLGREGRQRRGVSSWVRKSDGVKISAMTVRVEKRRRVGEKKKI